AGHFPGTPILPGVVLLDLALLFAPGACAGVRQIASAKFLSPVLPGEQVVISYSRTAGAALRFDVACGARKVASGTLVLAA
ncbi:MAG: 3-hydroxyacyl-ACP dehydratase, partial [Rhodoferax sp.]